MPRFSLRSLAAAVALLTAATYATAQAQSIDQLKKTSGSVVRGKVVESSPVRVIVKQGAKQVEVPVNEIDSIVYQGEPPELALARRNIANARFEDAAEQLQAIDVAALNRDLVQQDVEFYRALCAARLAIRGSLPAEQAGRDMFAFVSNHQNSYHRLVAIRLLGDLLLRLGRHRQAITYYEQLANTPWPESKVKSRVLVARVLMAENKYSEASAQLDQALAVMGDSVELKTQRAAATLGKAICLAESGQADAAAQSVETTIAELPPDQAELHAQAYNALGHCYRKAEKETDAVLAYLHVDLLYNTFADRHAEALANLAELWESVGKPERAREAKAMLRQRYPNSPWAN